MATLDRTRAVWRKSSFSGTTNSVEVAFVGWQKSSFSTDASNCVEVAFAEPRRVGVRDSKNTGGPVLAVPAETWRAFAGLLRHDRTGQDHI